MVHARAAADAAQHLLEFRRHRAAVIEQYDMIFSRLRRVLRHAGGKTRIDAHLLPVAERANTRKIWRRPPASAIFFQQAAM
jgi:hypothetical protein